MTIRFSFADQDFTATLDGSAAAREFLGLLPLDLTIEDYSTNEKIARLPQRLTSIVDKPFGNEAPGDLCYFAPWGNIALFHAGYRYSSGLIRLGRIDGPVTPLKVRGTFPLRISTAS